MKANMQSSLMRAWIPSDPTMPLEHLLCAMLSWVLRALHEQADKRPSVCETCLGGRSPTKANPAAKAGSVVGRYRGGRNRLLLEEVLCPRTQSSYLCNGVMDLPSKNSILGLEL